MSADKKPTPVFDVDLPSSEIFARPSIDQWTAAAQRSLGSKSIDTLSTRTLEGLRVKALYTAEDLPSEPINAVRDAGSKMETCFAIDLREAEEAVVESARGLARGADSLWLRIDRRSSNWGRLTLGVLSRLIEVADGAPIYLDGRGAGPALAALMAGAAKSLGLDAARLRGGFDFDPLGTLAADGTLGWSLDSSFAVMAEMAAWAEANAPQLRTTAISTIPYVNAGASAVDEVAYALATGVDYLRHHDNAGIDVAASSRRIRFITAVGRDFFMEVAKLRALRIAWDRVLEACNLNVGSDRPPIHAMTSSRSLTVRDPWVNLLRGTNQSFAAIAGGADVVTVLPFDSAVGRSDEFSNRIALNTLTILREECHLEHVSDPAAGSYFVDRLTSDLTHAAWEKFQAIEAAGGMSTSLRSGAIARELAETLAARRHAVSTTREPITGVSTYPNLEEQPLERRSEGQAIRREPDDEATGVHRAVEHLDASFAGAIDSAAGGFALPELIPLLPGHMQPERLTALASERDSQAFERLRDRADGFLEKIGTRPRVFVAAFGAAKEHRAISSFVSNLLAAGGIAAAFVENIDDPDAAMAAFSASGTRSAIICMAPNRAVNEIPDVARALKDRGARRVLAAIPPGGHDPSWRSAGVDGLVYRGCDAIKLLGELLEIEEVQRG